MFIVPKVWVEADGTLGARNGAVVTKVEHKMGIKGSATCELTLGDGVPCRGLLLGDVHDGIAQMFHVIEYARMGVGTKSMATLSTAYVNALDYTRVRKQGADLAKQADKAAPRVEIIRHPDVRRMLMLQKAFAEGLRAIVLWTAHVQDQVELRGGHGSAEARPLDALNDLMLPLIKGYGSEKVYELLAVSLQCFGGSGYCQDYPIEQYIRDQKIDSLYEGTTHIQALDLVVPQDRPRPRRDARRAARPDRARPSTALPAELDVEKAALGARARRRAGHARARCSSKIGASTSITSGMQGNRILFGARRARDRLAARRVGAGRARDKLRDAPAATIARSIEGKLAAARFFATEVLPGPHAREEARRAGRSGGDEARRRGLVTSYGQTSTWKSSNTEAPPYACAVAH